MNTSVEGQKTSMVRKIIQWFNPDRSLAIIAIIFSIVGIYFAVRQDHEAGRQRTRIEEIVSEISTRYVDKFPDNLSSIRELVEHAQKGDRLLIMTDYVGYGHYSSPKPYDEYFKAIKEAKRDRGVQVQLLVYDERATQNNLPLQFNKADFAAKTRGTERYRNYLSYYSIKSEPKTYPEFLNQLLWTQDRFCRELGDEDIAVKTTPVQHAMFIWLLERKGMVFAFPNLGDPDKGFSFYTKDDHLLSVFRDSFDKKWGSPTSMLRTDKHCYDKIKLF